MTRYADLRIVVRDESRRYKHSAIALALMPDFIDAPPKTMLRGMAAGIAGDPEVNAAKFKKAVGEIVATLFSEPRMGSDSFDQGLRSGKRANEFAPTPA